MNCRFLMMMLISILMLSCKRVNKLMEVSDNELTVQAYKKEENSEEVAYRVKVFPNSEFLKKNGDSIYEKMWYKMDSSFYLANEGFKLYPNIIEPIANGSKQDIEYLLIFPTYSAKKLELVYEDKFISGKIYNLN